MNLGILCSGGLGGEILYKLFDIHPINFVFTDLQSKEIIKFCINNNIPVFVGNPRGGKAANFIEANECDVLVSVNYLFIIEQDIIQLGKSLAFNVHGSLLPKYRGRTPHVWAIINGETKTGITAHIIDEGCDTGDILEQTIVDISDNDTGNNILLKFAKLYLPLITKVLLSYKNGTLKSKQQDNQKASYFGKRVPEDGQIDWNCKKIESRIGLERKLHPILELSLI